MTLIGQSIGRYHILEKLGQGGMATVYKAFDTRLDSNVAVKVIRTDMFPPAAMERVRKRFEREAKALARLNHPNIVSVIDYGEFEGAPYLVMKYMPGGTLKEQLGNPYSYAEAAWMLAPIARALAYAHQQGILHRDVKPANILLTQSGEPVLTDFGIAKLLEDGNGQTLTGTGVGIGTPEYMAPEQGLGTNIDGRADVYSLGVVFYELLCGRKPFSADTPLAVLYKQMNDPLPRLADFSIVVPAKVEQIIFKALAKKPENRFKDMTELAHALENLAQNSSVVNLPNQKIEAKPQNIELDTDGITRDDLVGVPNNFVQPSSTPQKKPVWQKWAVIGGLIVGLIAILVFGYLIPQNMRRSNESATKTAFSIEMDRIVTSVSQGKNPDEAIVHLTAVPLIVPNSDANPATKTAFALEMDQLQTSVVQGLYKDNPPKTATKTAQDSSFLFSEDFEDNKAQNISYFSGNWQIIEEESGNHVLDIDNSNSPMSPAIFFGSSDWEDYRVQFRAKFINSDSDNDGFIVEFRCGPESANKYIAAINRNNISLYYTNKENSNLQMIKSSEYQFESDKWYSFQVKAQDDSLKIIVGISPIIEANDDTFEKGSIQIVVNPKVHLVFDDIKVVSQ